LQGKAEPPLEEEIISEICESFKCTPSQAERELEHDPELVFAILDVRNYVQTWQQIERAEKQEDMPTGPMADLYGDFEVEAHYERKARLTDDDGR